MMHHCLLHQRETSPRRHRLLPPRETSPRHYSMATMATLMAIKLPVQSPPPHSRHRLVQLCLLPRPSNPHSRHRIVQLCLLLRPSNPRRQSVPCLSRPYLRQLRRLFVAMSPR